MSVSYGIHINANIVDTIYWDDFLLPYAVYKMAVVVNNGPAYYVYRRFRQFKK